MPAAVINCVAIKDVSELTRHERGDQAAHRRGVEDLGGRLSAHRLPSCIWPRTAEPRTALWGLR